MKAFIKQDGEYYEGDRESIHDLEVSKRPSHTSMWTGVEWVDNLEKVKTQESQSAMERLKELDDRSIRATRSIILSLIDGDEPHSDDVNILKGLEKEAEKERGKI